MRLIEWSPYWRAYRSIASQAARICLARRGSASLRGLRWSFGPFGVKDLFTLVNLMGGVVGIHFVLTGQLAWAGYALLLGYLLGDSLDGAVARLTHTSNRFGGEFDTATDHFVQAIVPGIIAYAVYARAGHPTLAIVLLSAVVGCATIRQAMFSVATLGDPLMYCGLPRTISGYASMAFVLSRWFTVHGDIAIPIGAILVPLLALMGLLPIPYMTHKGVRRMQLYVKFLVAGFLVTPVAALFVAREYTFDILFVWTAGYAAFGWFPLTAEEKRSFFERYRRWFADLSRA
ncbi:MAG TPA: CDP-alcohol phosphatidyltransferase family protein [Polyangia bacterium]